MFKPFPIRSAKGAAKYFSKEDNYYLSEVEAKNMSAWMGEGAKLLGLSGQVDEKTLQSLFEGRLPNGTVIGLQKDGSINHRAGFDLQFSAPKSASILILDGGDERLYKAHIAAVEKTLKIIERDCAQAKVYKNGQVSFENTKNLVIARVGHTASRKLDAHIHDHALVMNATQKEDGQWRALASSKTQNGEINGFAERVYDKQTYYGVTYRSFLAHSVKQFGYEIENVGLHGLWEIKGVPKEALDAMSKRRQEILAAEKASQFNSFKARDVIAQKTRDAKPANLDVNKLKQTWQAELAAVGFSSKGFVADALKNKDINTDKTEQVLVSASAKESVKDAVGYLSQYKIKLSYEKIIEKALEFSIGTTNHEDIVRAVSDTIKAKQFIPLDKAESYFVTNNLIASEKTIRGFVENGRGEAREVKIKDQIRSDIDTTEPSAKLAIDVLQSKDRLSLIDHRSANIQNFADTVLQAAERSGKTVHILSPNSFIAREMNQNIRRKSKTLWQWLVAQNKPELGDSVAGFNFKYKRELEAPLAARFRRGKDVIIVDGAEGLGNVDIQDLLRQTEKTKAKVIFLNDLNARKGFTAGNPLEVLKQAKIDEYFLNPVTEQKLDTIPELISITDDKERIERAAKLLVVKEDNERVNTLLVTGSKTQVKLANEVIRSELQKEGKLGGNERKITVLNSAGLNKTESLYASKYRQNMTVRIYERSGHKDWSVVRIDKEHNVLVLNHKNRRIRWNPKTNNDDFRVFKQEKLSLAAGDQIQATANMNLLGIKNSQQFIVKDIDDKHIKLTNGTQIKKIALKHLQGAHLDYNYATTIDKIPKKTSKHIIASIKAYSLDKPTIDTLKSKSAESLTILTNDTDKALKRFGDVPVKLTVTEAVLDAGHIDRLIDQKTITEIKSDVEKAITALTTKIDKTAAEKAVNFALEKITARNAGFTHKHLVEEALVHALETQLGSKREGVTRDDVMAVVNDKRKSGELIMGRHFSDGTRWTTKEVLDTERSIIADIKAGKDKFEPLIDRQDAIDILQDTNLTKDQKDAVFAIATGRNQFIVAQGDAGTGKTTMYVKLQELLKDKVEIQALAPTHQAVKELQDKGITAQTLKSFLIEHAKQKGKFNDKLFILDEASMVDNKDFAEFTKLMAKNGGRAAISGDIAQLIAVGSGKPYEITQRTNSTNITYLRENLRQQTPELKQVVKDILASDYKSAFEQIKKEDPGKHIDRTEDHLFFDTLKESIVEIDNKELKAGDIELEQRVAEDYLTRTPEIRDKTVVIVHAHDDRKQINHMIREGLKEQGTVNGNGAEVSRLIHKNLTTAEQKILTSYSANDVVKLGKKYYEVATKNPETKSILLRDDQGEKRYFYPDKQADKYNIEVFKQVKAELASGDVVRLTKTDKERKHFANFEYTVKDIVSNEMELISKDDGHSLKLVTNQLKDAHWDYAYTITGYGVQGSSKEYVIDYEVSHRKHLANQRSFYVAASRAKQHLMIYTNNKNALLNRIISNAGDKPAGLEVVGELNERTSNREQENHKVNHHEPNERKESSFIDARQVEQQLEANASQIVAQILGEPKKRHGSDYQYSYSDVFGGQGGKSDGGSLFVAVDGPKQGQWHCWKNGDKGNLLTLIQRRHNLDFKQSIEHAISMLGFDKEQFQSIAKPISDPIKLQESIKASDKYLPENWDAKQQKSVKHAQRLVQESLPIENTIAEKYLREHRGIQTALPENFRFHPAVYSGINKTARPALLVFGEDNQGRVQSTQAIFLDEKTANKADSLEVKKQTWGVVAGAPATIGNKENVGPTFVAEGPETALSILEAIPDSQVKITFGKSSFRHVYLSESSKDIVLCLDNDIDNKATEKLTDNAAKMLTEAGKNVWVAKPDEPGKDYNDLIKEQGTDAIISNLEQATPYEVYADENSKTDQKELEDVPTLQEIMGQQADLELGSEPLTEADKTLEIINNQEQQDMKLLNELAGLSGEIDIKKAATELENTDKSLAESENNSRINLDQLDKQKQLGDIEREIY